MASSSSTKLAKCPFISATLSVLVNKRKSNNKMCKVLEEKQMFGRLKYMFRFNFGTTGLIDIPVAAVDWADFTCEQQHRVCSIGYMTSSEWCHGPSQNIGFSQYIPLDEILPSRYCLTYDAVEFDHVECAFISLDPERIGSNINDSSIQDFGDNQFPHFKGTASTVRAYLDCLNEELDRNAADDEPYHDERIGFLPDSVQQFLSS